MMVIEFTCESDDVVFITNGEYITCIIDHEYTSTIFQVKDININCNKLYVYGRDKLGNTILLTVNTPSSEYNPSQKLSDLLNKQKSKEVRV
jgi:hypothetical protein